MSWLSSFLHPEKGYQKGQEELNKFFQQAQQTQQPYNQFGKDQYANLNEMIQKLMNPAALEDKWGAGYQESEAAKNAERMASERGLNAASSMGLMGSRPALDAMQAGTTQIGLDEKQNYLDNLMKKYLAGAGLSQGVFGTGANTATNMANNTMNMGQNTAQLKFGEENAPGSLLSKIMGGGVGLVGSAVGGPIGGALAKRWNLSGGA